MSDEAQKPLVDEQEEIGIRGPFGFNLMFRGHNTFSVVFTLVIGVALGIGLYFHDQSTQASAAATNKTVQDLKESQLKLEGTMKAVIFVLALSQPERDKLHLTEPRELRELKQGRGD